MNWNPGTFEIRELMPELDVPTLHPWFDLPHFQYWNMAGMKSDAVLNFYKAMQASSHEWAWVGTQNQEICFLIECYKPQHDQIAKYYDVAPGDIGMHFCVAPATTSRPGYTLDAMRHVMHYLFSNVGAHRVVVEPDVRNEKVRALNRKVGFAELGQISLSTKQAMLSIATQSAFEASLSISGKI
ncbi:acetyltransferase [Advenella kashmirensis W13003]|uniref:Acetyltransferase n=1 Tax=Advenella kashmirensis W13003 TaxID=1424334 RepID=V8QR60_9BURK|nr:GNAT family N-acetyltransferase [Advenella kashmirensis]ETF01474.1 acetyltransferase [Advenella kashmirensis W13003]